MLRLKTPLMDPLILGRRRTEDVALYQAAIAEGTRSQEPSKRKASYQRTSFRLHLQEQLTDPDGGRSHSAQADARVDQR